MAIEKRTGSESNRPNIGKRAKYNRYVRFVELNDGLDKVLKAAQLGGESFTLITATGTPQENGKRLLEEYNSARTKKPNGEDLSATNRYTILLAPGNYDLEEPLNVDTDFIDILPLSQDNTYNIQGDVIITSNNTIVVSNKLTVQDIVSDSNIIPSSSNEIVNITALAENTTIENPIGTWQDGQPLLIRIKDDGTPRDITWGTDYRIIGTTLPIITEASKWLYVGLIYNKLDNKWDVVGINQEI